MLKKLFRIVFTLIGLVVGFLIADSIFNMEYIKSIALLRNPISMVILYILITAIPGLILFVISPLLYKGMEKIIETIEKSAQKLPAIEIVFGTVGAIICLIIVSLIMIPFNKIFNRTNNVIAPVIFILINLLAVIIGADLAVKKKDDLIALFESWKRIGSKDKKHNKNVNKGVSKVLDTSVIIDGRIFDLCQTGFIEGPLVIPNFVLDELRHISDSSDGLKRTRGRRGLDILNKIQKELNIEVQPWEGDFPEIQEVDSKLLKLAQKLNGKVITNDYNLNKVAEFQGVPVLNINELANAIKPVVLPGEEMQLTIVKDGKESGQGVAYLDDGTMIVVEGGRKFMGEEIAVTVTSVLQTAAGRMIFAKQKD